VTPPARFRLAATSCAALALIAASTGCLLQPPSLAPSDAGRVLATRTLDAPHPADPGRYTVRTLTYGSSTDRRRAEYRDSVTYRTASVDASPFVSFAAGLAKSREKYWGFSTRAFPRNARVWYPDGDGPFPLVLVVHGNHDMKDYSDPGYDWIGERFASRGYIVASVDQNFLNGAARGENDARGWMLLKHLEVWRALADSAGKPLAGKVDLSRIVLVGHSRGGEAVAVAGAFNRLSHYPDDASQRFHFGFAIRGLVAIAPVDGQYRPADKPTPLTDVNYLVIHGTHDGDVSTFSGLAQYDRVQFTPGTDHFKSAMLMYRANHGQWNTRWNAFDNGRASARRLALGSLIDGEAQREFGRVVIGAFLEATLKDGTAYRAVFRDHRVAGDWLPPTMYSTRYADASELRLAGFEEDIDLTTGTLPGVTLASDSLSTWREFDLPFRSRNSTQRNSAVRLGWNNTPAGRDTTPRWPARYRVQLSDSLRQALAPSAAHAVTLSLFFTDQMPGLRRVTRDSSARDSSARDSAGRQAGARSGRDTTSRRRTPPVKDTAPPDLSVELVDASGRTARLPLSQFGPVRRPIASYVLRRRGRDSERFAALFEQVLHTYVLPLDAFARAPGGFAPESLREIRLVFDRTAVGSVHVDDIGLVQRPR
jgi:dienelactone hydrolase